jgi:L-ascorbate metabolism protein UlaG (beta-lactamase superfamily)
MLRKLVRLAVGVVVVALVALAAGMTVRPALRDAAHVSTGAPSRFAPGELRAQFFGTSTVLIGDGTVALLIDGFFSRPAWWRLAALPLGPDDARISYALSRGQISTLDAILVAHSHHDHALDSARVAARTNAVLHGSESTLNIARGERLPADRMRVIRPGAPIQVGDFTMMAIESVHAPGSVFPGTIDEPLALPARLARFKEAQSYAFLFTHPRGTVLVIPSANVIPGSLTGVRADVVFLGIGGLGKQSDAFVRTYWEETVVGTGARRVIPIHWDDFGVGLDQPLKAMPYLLDRVDTSIERLRALATANQVEVQMPDAFSPFGVP